MFCHHFYDQPQRGESLLEWKIRSILEPKLAQPESKVFTDMKSFLLDSAALKTSDGKKEKHLHGFSLFNTQEWKSVKSQSLYHHKKMQFHCKWPEHKLPAKFHTADINKPRFNILTVFWNTCCSQTSAAQSSCYLTHPSWSSMLYLLPRPVVYTFEKTVPHFWSISA